MAPKHNHRPARSRSGPSGREKSGREKSGREKGGAKRQRLSEERLLWGRHAIEAALANPARRIRRLLGTDSTVPEITAALTAIAANRRAVLPDPVVAAREELDALMPLGAVHQGWAAEVDPLEPLAIEDLADDPDASLIVVLDQVTDPHNVGAILRSVAAFGASAVVVQDRHSPPATGTLAKAASGALDVVPLVRVTNLARAIDTLAETDVCCVGLAGDAETALGDLSHTPRTAVVLGAEGTGLRRLTRERCQALVKLPTRAPIASLNVSAAAAVALYEIARRRS